MQQASFEIGKVDQRRSEGEKFAGTAARDSQPLGATQWPRAFEFQHSRQHLPATHPRVSFMSWAAQAVHRGAVLSAGRSVCSACGLA
jgi:hypothetical protein